MKNSLNDRTTFYYHDLTKKKHWNDFYQPSLIKIQNITRLYAWTRQTLRIEHLSWLSTMEYMHGSQAEGIAVVIQARMDS